MAPGGSAGAHTGGSSSSSSGGGGPPRAQPCKRQRSGATGGVRDWLRYASFGDVRGRGRMRRRRRQQLEQPGRAAHATAYDSLLPVASGPGLVPAVAELQRQLSTTAMTDGWGLAFQDP